MNYDKFVNGTVKAIKPSGIRKFFDVVSEKKNAISLGVGEPDFDTPWLGRNSAIRSIQKGLTQYTSNSGMPRLRELISAYYAKRYSLEYDYAKEIIVTVGASEAIDLALRATIEPGDEVLIPDPSYVSYSPCVMLAGGTPVSVPCYENDGFALTPSSLEAVITEKTKILVLPYPNNPTGGIMTREQLLSIAKIVIARDLFVISDEIYSELTYNESGHVSIASIDGMKERTAVINGFSKSFAMTGWRLGYVLAPKPICDAMYKIHQYTIMCAPTPAQYAGVAILEEELSNGFLAVNEMRSQYDMRRRYVYNTLKEYGFETFEPQGAFYVFPSVKGFGYTGERFASALLDKESVAVVPGNAFGASGENYIRISYAYSMPSLTKALERIFRFVESL